MTVECDRKTCLESWESDYLDADDTASVVGAASYLADFEGWVRDGEKIYCSSKCAEADGSGGPQ